MKWTNLKTQRVYIGCAILLMSLSCKENDPNGARGGWPNLPVKTDLYFFSSRNIQQVNLKTGVITSIGGSEDKPNQSRSVDVSRDGQEIAFNYFDYNSTLGKNIYEIRVMDPSGRQILAIPTPESFINVKI